MARAKKKFSPRRKKRGGKKYARRRKSSRGFKRVECQLGRAALMYSRAKGYLSRVEKGAARGKAENPYQGKLYPVMDRLDSEDKEALGIPRDQPVSPLPSIGMPARGVGAVWTGEFRNPKKGEWYLSGAIVEAYKARNNLTSKFNIARLVKKSAARGKAENPATRFRVHVRGKNVYYPSLEAARRATNDYFRRTGIVLGIEAVGGKHRNPKLRPFAGAKGPIKYPFFEVLGRKFDDLDTAKAFADLKAEESDKPVDVMSKPDSWTMAYEAYVAYPSSMSKAERKEFHDQRWHPRVTANPGKGPSAAQKSRLMRGKTVLKTEYEKFFAPKLRKFGWVPGKSGQQFPALFGSKGYFLVLVPSASTSGSVMLYQNDKYIEPN